MNKKYEYIKCILELIFSGDITGFQDMIPDWFLRFPIHNQLAWFFKMLRMKKIKDIMIYGGKYENKNWWYDYWDTDDIIDVVKGNFTFQLGIIVEKDLPSGSSYARQRSCICTVEVKNYDIFSMIIEDDEEEYNVISNGKIL